MLPAKLHELACMQHMHWCLPALLTYGESYGIYMFSVAKFIVRAHVCVPVSPARVLIKQA